MEVGDKIKQYRINKSLSLQQLGDLAGLSKATIQQYEDGTIKPSNKALMAVAEALNVDMWSFFNLKETNLELAEFRHGEKLTDTNLERERIHGLVIDYSANYIELENILNTKIVFENPLEDIIIQNYEDVEKAVNRVRKKWKLANNPIDDVCALLENKGFKIITFLRDTESPGLCGFMKDNEIEIPFIMLNNNNEHTREITRKRFTILHESAHLLLKFSHNISKDFEESLCNRFASAFLLPGEALIEYLGKDRTNISLEELKDLKEVYGISIQSIIYRSANIGLISESTCDHWINLYEAWREQQKDFGSYSKSREEPQRFSRLVTRGYLEKRISKEKVSEILDLKIEEIDKRFGSDKLSLM